MKTLTTTPCPECGLNMIGTWDDETKVYCIGCATISKAVGGKSVPVYHRGPSSRMVKRSCAYRGFHG